MASHRPIANGAGAPSLRQGKARREIVEEAEALALTEVDEPLNISGLCVALAVSERTLRKAFHKASGLPPCRYLRMLRLSQARRALLSADGERVTVTEIATSFGFVELGRFSVEYRKVFGERPSQTLRHACSGSDFSATEIADAHAGPILHSDSLPRGVQSAS